MWTKAIIAAGILTIGMTRGLSIDIPPEIVEAIAVVETGKENRAVGDRHSAFGAWQIHRLAIIDVNLTYGTNFNIDDAWDPAKARRICGLYLGLYGKKLERRLGRPATVAELARLWNGGPQGAAKETTREYGNRVVAVYEDIVKKARKQENLARK